MKNQLLSLKEKTEAQPYAVVRQTRTKTFPIYHFNLQSEVDCPKIVRFIEEQKSSLDDNKKNPSENFWRLLEVIKAWHSDYMYNTYKNSEFNNLCDIVINKVQKIFPDYLYIIDHHWFVCYNNKDEATVHSHGNADVAIVFYPEVAPNSSPLSIINDDSYIDVPITTGSLLVFPGEVLHYVKPSLHEGKRIAISMNLHKSMKAHTKPFLKR